MKPHNNNMVMTAPGDCVHRADYSRICAPLCKLYVPHVSDMSVVQTRQASAGSVRRRWRA